MIRSLILVCALATAAHADNKPHESPSVARARAELSTAKAHLKAAKATERDAKRASKRAAKIAKLRSQLAKVQHDPGTEIGCGTCTDNHDGSCTCPSVPFVAHVAPDGSQDDGCGE